MRSNLLLVFLLPLLACREVKSIEPIQGAVDVTFCNLLSRTDAPTKKLVRVSGLFIDIFENTTLRDPSCPEHAWIWFDSEFKKHTKSEVLKRFNSRVSSEKEFKVVFVGIVEGPLPPNKSMFPGYGHMSLFPIQLTVQAIESVE